jgi:DNA-binding transcriptional MerR regulator
VASRRAEERALTIDELALAAGMTVRTIRSHQAHGLLPPPEVRARTGYYGPEHVARLKLIRELQEEGFNLKGIRRLLERAPGASRQLLELKEAIIGPQADAERPEILTEAELRARFGPDVGVRTLAQATKLGLLAPLQGGDYEAPSPALLRAAEDVMARGVSLGAALAVTERVQRQCEAASKAFVRMFLDEVVAPFEREGSPEERLPEVIDAVESLRPLASEVLLTVFDQTMAREVQATFGRELRKRAKGR